MTCIKGYRWVEVTLTLPTCSDNKHAQISEVEIDRPPNEIGNQYSEMQIAIQLG